MIMTIPQHFQALQPEYLSQTARNNVVSLGYFTVGFFATFFRQTFHPTFGKVETEIELKVVPNGKKKTKVVPDTTAELTKERHEKARKKITAKHPVYMIDSKDHQYININLI
jgi:hypothetical protein